MQRCQCKDERPSSWVTSYWGERITRHNDIRDHIHKMAAARCAQLQKGGALPSPRKWPASCWCSRPRRRCEPPPVGNTQGSCCHRWSTTSLTKKCKLQLTNVRAGDFLHAPYPRISGWLAQNCGQGRISPKLCKADWQRRKCQPLDIPPLSSLNDGKQPCQSVPFCRTEANRWTWRYVTLLLIVLHCTTTLFLIYVPI